MPISENIRQARTAAKMTQIQLAEKVHVTQQAVQKWEQGQFPQTDRLQEIADACRTTVGGILYNNKNMDDERFWIAVDIEKENEKYIENLERKEHKTSTDNILLNLAKAMMEANVGNTVHCLFTEYEYHVFQEMRKINSEYTLDEHMRNIQEGAMKKIRAK